MESKIFYSQLFNILPTPSLVVLPDYPTFTIVEVSDAYEAIAQVSKGKIIGKGFFDAFPENPYKDDLDRDAAFLHVIRHKKPYRTASKRYEVPVPGSEKVEVKHFETINTPFLNEQDDVEFIVRTIIDSSEIKSYQSKEEAAKNKWVKSQKLLHETQNAAKIGSWELDLINYELVWSEVVWEILEVDPDLQPGFDSAFDFYKEGESRQKIINAVNDAKEQGLSYDLELEILTAKGKERWIRTTGKPEIHQGQCTRIYGTIQDITQSKNTERNLLVSKNQLESLIQSVDGVVWEADMDINKTTFMSAKVRSITGYTTEEWTAHPDFWKDHIYADDRDKTIKEYQSLKEYPRNLILDYRLIKADGNLVWIRDRMTVIHENGQPKWIRGLMVDNTANKRYSEWEYLEKTVLQLNTLKDVPIEEILTVYLKGIETLFPKMTCSLYRFSHQQLHHWSSPSLPKSFIEEVGALSVEDQVTSCGSAAFRKEIIMVNDIAKDSGWSNYKDIVLSYGLQACWSYPIMDSDRNVLAVLVIYYKETKGPEEEEEKIIERSLSLLKIILENRHNLKALQDTAILMKQGQDMANLGHWQWDIIHNQVKWSDSLYKIYGLDRENFLATYEGYLQLLIPEDRESVQLKIENALATKTDVEFEERILRPNGEIRFLNSWAKLIVDENDRPIELIGACLDITERKKIEEELNKSETLLKSLLEDLNTSNERYEYINKATNDAIYDWKINNQKIEWGEGFYRLFGYRSFSAKFKFSDWSFYVHPLDLPQMEHDLKAFLEDHSQSSCVKEYRFRKSDDTFAYVEESRYVIRDKSGKPIRMIGAMRDISGRKSNQEKMEKLHAELERNLKVLALSNAELEQFAYVVSHDLQEPLRMITSFLTQLEKRYGELLDEKGKQYIEYAVGGANRMRQIILDLLNFSKVGQLDDDLSEVDLNGLLEDILILYKRKIKEKGAIIEIENLPVLFTLKSSMRQVFQHLISNGLMYQKEGNRPHIKISCQETATDWQFTVADNGIGIGRDFHDKIFNVFHRLQRREDFPGSGMGLAVTKKIVESFGGKIWVESEQGKGSKFHFTVSKIKTNITE